MCASEWATLFGRAVLCQQRRVGGSAMSPDAVVDAVRSYSSGIVGRTLNSARTNHFVLDSPSGPGEAVGNGEAFLSGISSCGVTLIEHYAQENGIPIKRMEVTIEGVRRPPNMALFEAVNMRFEFSGVEQSQAEKLVQVWRDR